MVHSMPGTQEAALPIQISGRWKMLAIMLVCSLPVIASYFAYYVVRPQVHAGYGELIEPVRAVPHQTGSTLEGVAKPLPGLKGHWLLVAVAGGACPEECQRRLFLMRQLRATLGHDKERVDWVWLISDQAPVDKALLQGMQDAVVLRVDPATLDQWLPAAPGHAQTQHLFVVDPLGNTMMRFPALFDPAGASKVRRDLDPLLRASASWDQQGR
jgi:hypothetical protein